MRPEYWLLAALILAIAELIAPGTFLIFFALGALVTAIVTIVIDDLAIELAVFVVASIAAALAGHSLYRRLLGRHGRDLLGRRPIGEPGIVEEPIVNGRGKVQVRGISWLAEGPDLDAGTPIVVVRRKGTLLEVRRR